MDKPLETSLASIIEGLSDALWLRDAQSGAFLYCSPRCEDVWGVPARELIRQPALFSNRILPEDRARVIDALAGARDGAVFDQQYRILISPGRLKWIHDRGSLLRREPAEPPRLVGLARDITDYKSLETEVRKAYDALRSSVNGVIITDRNGAITYANPAFLSLFRFSDVGEAIGSRVEDLFIGDDIDEVSELKEHHDESGRRTREIVVRRQDDSRVFVEVSSSAVHDGQGNVVGDMASFLDVTERKQREAEVRRHHIFLQRLTERMAELEESERRRISDQIHDTAVQSLSLSNIRLGSVRKAISDAGLEAAVRQLDASRELIEEGIRQCRLIMGDLTPPLLYELGLAPALKQFAERIQSLQGIPIKVEESSRNIAVPESLRGLLFQSTRELILNACKHAAPSRVHIQLSGSDTEVRISVRDDGCGFDTRLARKQGWTESGGVGLFRIRQRLERVGGCMDFDSTPGQGTDISIKVRTSGACEAPSSPIRRGEL